MENLEDNTYKKATKRVKELKDFYRHLKVFVVINAILYLFKSGALILAVHTAYLFRHKLTFLKKWEERQIQKYIEKNEHENRRYK